LKVFAASAAGRDYHRAGKVNIVMEMMETRITREKAPVVYDLDDYRRGLRDSPGDARVTITPYHRVDLWTIPAGQTVPLHTHTRSECVMIVMAGQGEYNCEGRSYDLKKDSLTVVPSGSAHGIRNTNPEPLVVLTIEGPGPFDAIVKSAEPGKNFH
jgi:mannose-6-phosphate isomerase-like protein (cupin superfamily)